MACTYYRHDELQATEAGCPFCHPTSPRVINLNGAPVSPGVLAQIATALETYGAVKVVNAAIPTHGPGLAALMLGYEIKQNPFGEPEEEQK